MKTLASAFHNRAKEQKTESGFGNVDRTSDPRSFVHCLDKVRAMPGIQAGKRLSFELLHVQKGDRILDVGCGTGDDGIALAKIVGSTGVVVGVDESKVMIAEARRRANRLNLPVQFRRCDAHQLDFPDNSFDGCRAERIFNYLKDPRQALSEIIRVARPGARIVVTEPDWETLVITVDDQTISRKVVELLRDSLCNSGIAHHLPILFKELGLNDITVGAGTFIVTDFAAAESGLRLQSTVEEARVRGEISNGQAVKWLACLEEASQSGRFFGAVTAFTVIGGKPR